MWAQAPAPVTRAARGLSADDGSALVPCEVPVAAHPAGSPCTCTLLRPPRLQSVRLGPSTRVATAWHDDSRASRPPP